MNSVFLRRSGAWFDLRTNGRTGRREDVLSASIGSLGEPLEGRGTIDVRSGSSNEPLGGRATMSSALVGRLVHPMNRQPPSA
jgi:hypothetical protein